MNNNTTCPQCMEITLETFVNITVKIPYGWSNLSKSGIRKKEVEIISADWPNTKFICNNCGWYASSKIKKESS